MPALGHRPHARLARVFQMIGGERAKARGERRAAQVRELIGVQLDRQAMASRGLEHARDLGGRERDLLAEGIDRVGEAPPRDLGQHLVADEVQIARPVVRGPGRQSVGAEEGRPDLDPGLATEPAGDFQHAQLGLEIEAVARLDLDRGHAVRAQGLEATPRALLERLGAGGPGRPDGAGDAAARARDRLVGDALEALLELGRTVAREHEVGVAVDQAGRQPAAPAVDQEAGVPMRQLGLGADPGDPAALDRERALCDRAVGAALLGHGRETDVGP